MTKLEDIAGGLEDILYDLRQIIKSSGAGGAVVEAPAPPAPTISQNAQVAPKSPQPPDKPLRYPAGDKIALRADMGALPYPEPRDWRDFAINITALWEGPTWGEHGDGAYGILGFSGDWRARVFELDPAGGPDAQRAIAEELVNKVHLASIVQRGISSTLGKAMIVDMAVNHGMRHELFAEVDRDLGMTDAPSPSYKGYRKTQPRDEANYLLRLAKKRIERRAHLYEQYPGLRDRYNWWVDVIEKPAEAVYLKGHSLAVPEVPTARFHSPVARGSAVMIPPPWSDATGFCQQLPRSSFIPKKMWGKYHSGVDLNLPDDKDDGAPVYAIADGEVIFAGNPGYGWGNVVVIDHGDLCSRYGHLRDPIRNAVGTRVERGAIIGSIGDAGRYQAHLHFDLCHSGKLREEPGWYSYFDTADEVRAHFKQPQRP